YFDFLVFVQMESFKMNQCAEHALHSVFNLKTGMTYVDHNQYGHLQIDVVSLFLLYLVQMITSGLQVSTKFTFVLYFLVCVLYSNKGFCDIFAFFTALYNFWF